MRVCTLFTASLWHNKLKHSRQIHAAGRSCTVCQGLIQNTSCSHRTQPQASHALRLSTDKLVDLGDTPVGKGLVSCGTHQPGTCLLDVPFVEVVAIADTGVRPQKIHTALKEATAAHSTLPDGLLRFVRGTQHAALRLAAALLWLRRHGSAFWQEYIAGLPQEADMSCLLNYTLQEQPELQHLAAEAELEHQQACRFHDTIFSSTTGCLKAWRLADQAEDTLWALSTVYSRALTDQVPRTDTAVSMLVPRVDLANHSFDANAEWVADFARGSVTLQATQQIAEGEPVCIDYGADLDNTALMHMFGFVVPGNPNDRLDLGSMQQADGLDGADQGQHYLLPDPFLNSVGLDSIVKQSDKASCSHNRNSIVSCHQDPVLSRKLAALLSLAMHDADYHAEAADRCSDRGKLRQAEPGSSTGLNSRQAAHQRQSAEHLQRHFEATLSSYPTSISTDEELLQTHQELTSQHAQQALTTRHVQAVRARLEHKLLIAAAIEMLETYTTTILG